MLNHLKNLKNSTSRLKISRLKASTSFRDNRNQFISPRTDLKQEIDTSVASHANVSDFMPKDDNMLENLTEKSEKSEIVILDRLLENFQGLIQMNGQNQNSKIASYHNLQAFNVFLLHLFQDNQITPLRARHLLQNYLFKIHESSEIFRENSSPKNIKSLENITSKLIALTINNPDVIDIDLILGIFYYFEVVFLDNDSENFIDLVGFYDYGIERIFSEINEINLSQMSQVMPVIDSLLDRIDNLESSVNF